MPGEGHNGRLYMVSNTCEIGTLISKDINQQVASMVGIFSGYCYTIRVVL